MNAPDRIDAAQKAVVQISTHPATWVPFVPIAAAYAFLGLPWVLCFVLTLIVAAVVCRVWMQRWPKLMDQARTGLLKDYRNEENAALYTRLRELTGALSHQPTNRLLYDLREAMEIKHAVEKRVFADSIITPHEEEVSEMIADTVRTMLNEAEKVPLIESTQWPRATAKVEKTLESLRRAFEGIDVILDPVPEELRLPAEDNDALARAGERLEERLTLARGVRRHLESGRIIHDSDPVRPPETTSEPPARQPTLES